MDSKEETIRQEKHREWIVELDRIWAIADRKRQAKECYDDIWDVAERKRRFFGSDTMKTLAYYENEMKNK